MSRSVTLNSVSFSLPQTGDSGWSLTGGVDDYLVALATGVLTKAGGSFTLTADVNLGATYGLKTAYYTSQTAAPAAAGQLRLAKTDTVSWRNNANSADLTLGVSATDVLQFGSTPILNLALGAGNTALTMNSGGTAYAWTTIVNAQIDAAAAIAYSKLNLTGAVLNADLAGSIAYSKLALTNSVVNADVSSSAAIAYSKLALTGSIVNADVSASAAVAYSKLNLAASVATGDLASGMLVPVAKGGTGLTGGTSGGIPYYSGASTVASTAALAANGVVIGGGAGVAPATIVAGTADQVLVTPHGGGAPGFGQVDLAQAAAVKNALPIANGGTGQTTANTAINALLPSQGSNNGKVLSTDGTNPSWAAALTTTLTSANLFVGNDSNVATAVPTTGDAIIDNTGYIKVSLGTASSSPAGTGTIGGVSNSVLLMSPSADSTITFDTTHTAGRIFTIVNKSGTYKLTIVANDTSVIRTVYPLTTAQIVCLTTSTGVTAGWDGIGLVASNWIACSPAISGFGAVIGNSGFYRRVGARMELYGVFKTGTPTAVAAQITIPGSYSMDATYYVVGQTQAGNYSELGSGTTVFGANDGQLYVVDATHIGFAQGHAASVYTNANGNGTANPSDWMNYQAIVPISGWSATKG